jgi:HK97 family phage prohead protease
MTKLNSAGMAWARSLFLSSNIDRSAPSPGFIERKGAAIEFKFVSDADPGVFEGYGGVFHNVDSYGNLILPGAFAASLAEYKAMPGMYAEHSIYTPGGDLLPIGRWLDMGEDGKGLRVKGKISALDTDHGKRIRALMLDDALGGLSIAYSVPKGGAVHGDGKKADEPRRTLRAVNLTSWTLCAIPPTRARASIRSRRCSRWSVTRPHRRRLPRLSHSIARLRLGSVIEQHGLVVVFLNVLLAQGGLPLPAFPTLMAAGALVTQSRYQVHEIILSGVSGSAVFNLECSI